MGKFATAINCMDGRVQIPVIEYIKSKYEVDYVDMITLWPLHPRLKLLVSQIYCAYTNEITENEWFKDVPP